MLLEIIMGIYLSLILLILLVALIVFVSYMIIDFKRLYRIEKEERKLQNAEKVKR